MGRQGPLARSTLPGNDDPSTVVGGTAAEEVTAYLAPARVRAVSPLTGISLPAKRLRVRARQLPPAMEGRPGRRSHWFVDGHRTEDHRVTGRPCGLAS